MGDEFLDSSNGDFTDGNDGFRDSAAPQGSNDWDFETDPDALISALDAEEAAAAGAGAPGAIREDSDEESPPPEEDGSDSDTESDQDLCLQLKSGVHFLRGKRKTMEDAHYITAAPFIVEKDGERQVRWEGFYGVYDGHGGDSTALYLEEHLHNNVYTNLVPHRTSASETSTGINDLRVAMNDGFRKTEADFIEKALNETVDSGSTAIVAMVSGRNLVVSNVGDSEGILWRKGRSKVLTTIHNPKKNAQEEQRIKAAGGALYNKRVAHPVMPPAMCNIAVSRAFGDLMFKHPKYTRGKPSGLVADPDTSAHVLTASDEFIVLACDGVWDVMSHHDVGSFVAKALEDTTFDAQAAAEMLVQEAYDRGSGDNISAIVVVFEFLSMDDAVAKYDTVNPPGPYVPKNAAAAASAAAAGPAPTDNKASAAAASSSSESSSAPLIQLDLARIPQTGAPVNGSHRNVAGTSTKMLYGWKDLGFTEQVGSLEVQQYIQQLVRADPSDVDALLAAPDNVDSIVWQYEHLRQLTLELNHLAVMLNDSCRTETCPKMMATQEWMFLCAAHKEAIECSAIDYILHTLDGTACLLNSNKHFPNRSTISDTSRQFFQSIARRLYRINAHAYFHHRQVFDDFERQTHVTERFHALAIKFKLIARKMRIIPNDFITKPSSSLLAGAGDDD